MNIRSDSPFHSGAPGLSGLGYAGEGADPFAYPAAPMDNSGVPSDLGQTFTDLFRGVSQVGNTYLQYETQKRLLDTNAELIRQGKPPISGSALRPGVEFGLTPQTMMLIGGIALAAFLLLRR